MARRSSAVAAARGLPDAPRLVDPSESTPAEANTAPPERLLPVGAEVVPGGVHFRVWASRSREVAVLLDEGQRIELAPEPGGYFGGFAPGLGAGARYRYELDREGRWPDPASRFQPEGPTGPSVVVDPRAHHWTDGAWAGIWPEGQVLYEVHVGTFTREGTWAAAAAQLPALAELGVTAVEMMPIGAFPGRFGWGYDVVSFYAPSQLYGEPDDLRRFIDRAHALGLGVILDFVCNHVGPQDSTLDRFSEDWLSQRHATDWGKTFNFDDRGSAAVREFFIANAAYWISEFHFDGLRLDATQDVHDDSEPHVIAEIVSAARDAAGGRGIVIVAENEPQHTWITRPREEGGWGVDALWNDDFHHTAMVRLTGRREAYYTDYLGSAQEMVSCSKYGTLYQGQRYSWQGKRRGHPALDLPPYAFVNYLQNHDQVANALAGLRMHDLGSPGEVRALTALLLLMPGTPLLFQGQDFGAENPFLYFADLSPDLVTSVREGRADFLAQFPSMSQPGSRAALPDPFDPETFARCCLDHAQREANREVFLLHRHLLRLRRTDPVLSGRRRVRIDGAVLSGDAFMLRYFGGSGGDRLLLVNLGRDLPLTSAPEPLLAPPSQRVWELLWTSEAVVYGGTEPPHPESDEGWRVTGRATTVLRSAAVRTHPENGKEER